MKNSFSSFILREIHKPHINRMPLNSFTQAIKRQSQNVPTQQLLYIYHQLQKLNHIESNPNLSKTIPNHIYSKQSKQSTIKTQKTSKKIVQISPYLKSTAICLQQIVIKQKQKQGYQKNAHLIKLHYLRLLTALQYNLPYVNILEEFREEILFSDVGTDIIDYLDIITKNPTQKTPTLIQTVNFIVQVLKQELQNLEVLDLPRVKIAFIKGSNLHIYQNIDQKLFNIIDELINKNKYRYSYKQIEQSISHLDKNIELHQYYSFMTNDPIEKRLNFMSLNAKRSEPPKFILGNIQTIYLPGRPITIDNYDRIIHKIQQLSLYKPYLNIFQQSLSQLQIILESNQQQFNTFQYNFPKLFRCYVQYHFNYLYVEGFKKLSSNKTEICLNLEKLISYSKNNNVDLIKSSSIQFVELLTFCISLILKTRSTFEQQKQYSFNDSNFNKHLNSVICSELEDTQNHNKKLKDWNNQIIHEIFQNTLKYAEFDHESFKTVKLYFSYFYSQQFQVKDEYNNTLQKIITNQLNNYNKEKKIFIQNKFLLFTLVILDCQIIDRNQAILALKITKIFLDILSRSEYKKFSVQFLTIQKILILVDKHIGKKE